MSSPERIPSPVDDGREREAHWFTQCFGALAANVTSVVRGKQPQVFGALRCLLAEGHLLLEDVPGVGKTSLAKAIARSIDGTFGRVQFTPDVLPTDVVGTSVWNQRDGSFEFRPGPVFANILLADEINRASPRTQSALLEAMAERQVTAEGTSRPLPRPFMVIATQNPLEHHGTYELPESQMDRFMMRLSLGYPERASELDMLEMDGAEAALEAMTPAITLQHLAAMIEHCGNVHVSDAAARYVLDIIGATRESRLISLGASPRAALGLQKTARVTAAIDGRAFVSPDDVKAMARLVLPHRITLSRESLLQGDDPQTVVDSILSSVPIPA